MASLSMATRSAFLFPNRAGPHPPSLVTRTFVEVLGATLRIAISPALLILFCTAFETASLHAAHQPLTFEATIRNGTFVIVAVVDAYR